MLLLNCKLQSSQIIQMQIRLKPKTDEKLLENYPDDPYTDLSIITKSKKLNLVLTYLTIDSGYFSKIDPDTREINLSHLQEEPLLKVIRSLYGDELVADSIAELTQLYEMCLELEIDDYNANIESQIRQKPKVLQSLEFLEFSFSFQILTKEVIEFHVSNKLKLFESSRSYLQLNKVSLTSFHRILTAYLQSLIESQGFSTKGDYGEEERVFPQILETEDSKIINHVMENYFNRNNIKAANYFKQFSNCSTLESIWGKYHHKIYYPQQQPCSTKSMNSSELLSPANHPQKIRKKSDTIESVSDTALKKKRVQTLEDQLAAKDLLIEQLRAELALLKQDKFQVRKKLSGGNKVTRLLDDEEQQAEGKDETTIGFFPAATRKSKKFEEEDEFTLSSGFEPAFDANRKIPESKQIRTMKKAPGVKNRILPN